MGHKGPVKTRPRCIGAERPRTQMQIDQSITQSIAHSRHCNETRGKYALTAVGLKHGLNVVGDNVLYKQVLPAVSDKTAGTPNNLSTQYLGNKEQQSSCLYAAVFTCCVLPLPTGTSAHDVSI